MTEDDEAAEIVRRLSMTQNERMYWDLHKSLEEIQKIFKSKYYYTQKEDGDKERTD